MGAGEVRQLGEVERMVEGLVTERRMEGLKDLELVDVLWRGPELLEQPAEKWIDEVPYGLDRKINKTSILKAFKSTNSISAWYAR